MTEIEKVSKGEVVGVLNSVAGILARLAKEVQIGEYPPAKLYGYLVRGKDAAGNRCSLRLAEVAEAVQAMEASSGEWKGRKPSLSEEQLLRYMEQVGDIEVWAFFWEVHNGVCPGGMLEAELEVKELRDQCEWLLTNGYSHRFAGHLGIPHYEITDAGRKHLEGLREKEEELALAS